MPARWAGHGRHTYRMPRNPRVHLNVTAGLPPALGAARGRRVPDAAVINPGAWHVQGNGRFDVVRNSTDTKSKTAIFDSTSFSPLHIARSAGLVPSFPHGVPIRMPGCICPVLGYIRWRQPGLLACDRLWVEWPFPDSHPDSHRTAGQERRDFDGGRGGGQGDLADDDLPDGP